MGLINHNKHNSSCWKKAASLLKNKAVDLISKHNAEYCSRTSELVYVSTAVQMQIGKKQI